MPKYHQSPRPPHSIIPMSSQEDFLFGAIGPEVDSETESVLIPEQFQSDCTCKIVLTSSSICVLILGFVGGIISLYAFSILYLVQDYSLDRSCTSTNLWASVIVMCVLFFCNLTPHNRRNIGDGNKTGKLVYGCLSVINISMVVWSTIELYNNSIACPALQKSNIYTIALMWFGLYLSSTIICVCVFISLWLPQ